MDGISPSVARFHELRRCLAKELHGRTKLLEGLSGERSRCRGEHACGLLQILLCPLKIRFAVGAICSDSFLDGFSKSIAGQHQGVRSNRASLRSGLGCHRVVRFRRYAFDWFWGRLRNGHGTSYPDRPLDRHASFGDKDCGQEQSSHRDERNDEPRYDTEAEGQGKYARARCVQGTLTPSPRVHFESCEKASCSVTHPIAGVADAVQQSCIRRRAPVTAGYCRLN